MAASALLPDPWTRYGFHRARSPDRAGDRLRHLSESPTSWSASPVIARTQANLDKSMPEIAAASWLRGMKRMQPDFGMCGSIASPVWTYLSPRLRYASGGLRERLSWCHAKSPSEPGAFQCTWLMICLRSWPIKGSSRSRSACPAGPRSAPADERRPLNHSHERFAFGASRLCATL